VEVGGSTTCQLIGGVWGGCIVIVTSQHFVSWALSLDCEHSLLISADLRPGCVVPVLLPRFPKHGEQPIRLSQVTLNAEIHNNNNNNNNSLSNSLTAFVEEALRLSQVYKKLCS